MATLHHCHSFTGPVSGVFDMITLGAAEIDCEYQIMVVDKGSQGPVYKTCRLGPER
jgi:hypothetical protein